ncbi:hypothetical protein AVEN_138270-1 [Araneus ventricosus]|uniref:Uncharacterized protein n=1 Tax=Araneus ventricosus TaxID=182803 RepID=A0A4Y2A865_ARAVE|nr:hypothetical protein AVEN_138270-1 [Araneus ventricosus]
MVCDNPIDTAVHQITETLIAAAEDSITKTKNNFRRKRKVWWNSDCREAYKNQRKAWGRFRRYPTSANFILYKQAKAYSRRIQRRSQRESWKRYVSSLNSTISSKKLREKVKKASGIFIDRNINILYQNGIPVTSLQDIASCIASTLSQTSNSNTYPSSFQNNKNLAEKQKN